MDVKTVCLGMLSDGEASGYDLKKHFESTFGHFFPAGYGSIYPALSALAEAGLVKCEHVPQDGKPDRKVYRITDAGREKLLEALNDPSPTHKVRSEFLATMWFAHLMSPQQIQTVLESRMQDIACFMKMFEDFETRGMDDWPQGMQFVCGFGKAMMQTMRKYIEDNQDKLTDKPVAKRPATG